MAGRSPEDPARVLAKYRLSCECDCDLCSAAQQDWIGYGAHGGRGQSGESDIRLSPEQGIPTGRQVDHDSPVDEEMVALWGTRVHRSHHPCGERLAGWSSDYYRLPEGATELQDLIEHKGMSFAVGNIFKAAYRLGNKRGTDEIYDLHKIIWFAERELRRVTDERSTTDQS